MKIMKHPIVPKNFLEKVLASNPNFSLISDGLETV